VSKVHIITDSGAHFADPTVPERLGITVVPQIIQFGQQRFREGVDLDAEEFFRRLPHYPDMPEALPPSVDDFRTLYGGRIKRDEQILSIHTSSRMSNTLLNARQAAGEFLGRSKIIALDSMHTSLGLGILAEATAEAALNGASLDDLVRLARGMIPHMYAVFFTDTLDYLERAGRLSKSQSILGTMLNIRPFLTFEEGEIIPIEKVRTREKAIDKLIEFVSEFSYIERVAIMQSVEHPTEDTQLLLERLEQTFPGQYFPVMMYGATLACLIGPNSLGIVIYEGVSR